MLRKIIVLIFRCIYYLLYHQFAWSYDYVAGLVSLGRWNNWVNYTLPLITGKRVLEIGFGPGHLLLTAMRNNIDMIGLDESKQMVRRASRMIETAGYTPPIIRGDVFSMPFQDYYFNQVIATFPADYIFDSKAIFEIHRVLLPGGQLIILPFAWIKGKLWDEKFTGHWLNIDIITQTWYEKFSQAITQQGFEIMINQIEDAKSNIIFIVATKPVNEISNRTEVLVC